MVSKARANKNKFKRAGQMLPVMKFAVLEAFELVFLAA
jgi:hypothetical protein